MIFTTLTITFLTSLGVSNFVVGRLTRPATLCLILIRTVHLPEFTKVTCVRRGQCVLLGQILMGTLLVLTTFSSRWSLSLW